MIAMSAMRPRTFQNRYDTGPASEASLAYESITCLWQHGAHGYRQCAPSSLSLSSFKTVIQLCNSATAQSQSEEGEARGERKERREEGEARGRRGERKERREESGERREARASVSLAAHTKHRASHRLQETVGGRVAP